MDYDAWNDPARWQYETAEPDEPREPPHDLAAEMIGCALAHQAERILLCKEE